MIDSPGKAKKNFFSSIPNQVWGQALCVVISYACVSMQKNKIEKERATTCPKKQH